MRTFEEIAQRAREADSFFGFAQEVLVPYLPYSHARAFLKPEVTEQEWTPEPLSEAEKEAREYLAFAWEKAQDHRGFSAGRSVEKIREYAWLLGADELVEQIESGEIPYTQYGCPVLAAIADHFGWEKPADEQTRRMIEGLPCRVGCREGCGG